MCGRTLAALVVLCLSMLGQHGSINAVNPYTGPEHAAAGAGLFKAQCAGCHGPDGSGTGQGVSLVSGTFRRGGSDEALFETITKGVPGTSMPGFALSGLQVWQLVTNIRALNIARGAGDTKGDAKAGFEIFRASCSGCHMVTGEGGLSGPDLSGIGSRRTEADLRAAVLEPDARVSAEYWSMAVRTSSGKQLRGIRLNEDTYSIQLRDPAGKLMSIPKSDVANSELIRRSPMPAFAGKLSDEQLTNLIAYLTRLR